MSRQESRPAYYALVLATTALVVVVPALVVYLLRANGVVTDFWVCLLLAAGLALAASFGASALWRRHRLLPGIVFSDLLVWGWLRREYTERQISRALGSLDRLGSSDTGGERTQFLTQLALALDERDPYLHGHSQRVSRHAAGTARRMGLRGEEIVLIETAALLHDVGKLHTPSKVLQKEGPLTDAEYAVIKQHVDDGAKLVGTLGDPKLTVVVLQHHERFDGSGYPSGLKGDEIPLGARVIAVADTFDAITSARPYREGVQDKRALDVLHREAGRQLDPAAVHAFIAYYSDRDISAFSSMVLSSFRTEPLRSLHTALAGVLAAGLFATAAIAASTPKHARTSTPGTQLAARAGGAIAGTGPLPPSSAAARAQRLKASASSAQRPARSAAAVVAGHNALASPFSPRSSSSSSSPFSSPTTLAPVPAASVPPAASQAPARPPAPTPTGTQRPTTTSTTTTTRATPLPAPIGTTTTQPTSSAPAPSSSTTTTAPETAMTTTTATTTTTTPRVTADPCKNGGWIPLGYKKQGQCESAQHHGG
jgi:putative nucleotidyltransferase with HDIG domain